MKTPAFTKRTRTSTIRLILAGSVAVLLGVPCGKAATIYWDGTGTSWNSISDWSTASGATMPDPAAVPGTADVATFNTTILNTAQTLTLDAAQSALGLAFNSTGTVTLNAGTGGSASTLTLGTSGIAIASGAGADSINTNLVLGGAQSWTNSSSNLFTEAGNIDNGANLLTIAGTGNTTISGVIGSGATVTGGLTKSGAGTLTLSGANLYTGGTTLNGGNLALSGSGTIKASTGLTFNGGSLTLTNATAGDALMDRVSNSAAITSNGGTFTYANTSGTTTYAETIGAVALTSGQLNIVESTNQAGTGSQTLTLSGLTQNGTSAVTFSAATTGPAASKNIIVVTGATATSAGQIIGPWATTGTAANAQTDYAVYNGSAQVVPAAIAAGAESTWTTAVNAYTANAGLGAVTLTGTRNITGLRTLSAANSVTFTANSPTITLTGNTLNNGDAVVFGGTTVPTGLTAGTVYFVVNQSGNTFQVSATSGGTAITPTTAGSAVNATGAILVSSGNNLGTYGILNGVSNTLTIAATGTGAVTLPTTAAGNLYVNAGSGAITINAPITDNTGSLTLVKNGTNTLTLGGTNTYTGGTIINGGTVVLTNTTNPAINLGGAGSNVTFNGSGTLTIPYTGNATTLGALAVNGAGTVATLNGGSGSGNAFTFSGAVTGNGTLNCLSSGGGYATNVNLNSTANTFTGPIIIGNGSSYISQLNVNSLGDGPGAGAIQLGYSNLTIPFNYGSGAIAPLTLNYRQIVLGGTTGGATIQNNSTTQAITINTNLGISGTGNKTLTLGAVAGPTNVWGGNIADGTGSSIAVATSGAGNWTISGNMSNTGGVSIGGTGTLTLSGTNTYSGQTQFNTGGATLTFAGTQAVSPNTSFLMNVNASTASSTIKLLDDTGGVNNSTVTVPNTFTIQGNNTPGNDHTFIVGNNNTANGGASSGTTTGSTIAIGTLNWGTEANGTTNIGSIPIQGFNGYRLQINNVTLYNGSALTAGANYNMTFKPTTANVTLGTVTMATGNAGKGVPYLVLDGTSSDNRITGTISDATDVGTTLHPVNLTKSNTSTWTLSGTSTYTGTTTISGGTLAGIGANAFGSTSGISVGATAGATLSLLGDSSTNFVKASDSSLYSVTTTTGSGVTINADRATVAGTGAKTMGIGTLLLNTAVTNATTFTGANNTSLSIGAVTTGNSASGTETLTNNISGGGSLTLASVSVLRTGTPTLTFNGTGNTTVSGAITQAATTALTFSGSGILTLSGTSTYTGATTVSSGTLALGNGGNLGATAVTVSNGGTFGVTQTASGTSNAIGAATFTLNAGSALNMNDGFTSTLNLGGAATLAPATGTASVLTFNAAAATGTSDLLAITGAATVGAAKATIAPVFLATPSSSANTYTLITAASGLNTNFTLGGARNYVIGGSIYQTSLSTSTPTAEILSFTAGAATPTAAYWQGGIDGSWTSQNGITSSTNFTADAAGTLNTLALPGSVSTIFITANAVTNATATLDQAFSVLGLVFTGTGTANTVGSTIASGTGGSASTLTIGTGGITVNAGSGANTISAPVILGAAQSWTNNSGNLLTVSGNIDNGANLLTIAGSGNTTISGILGSGTTNTGGLTVNATGATVTLSGVNAYTGATTITAGALTFAGASAMSSSSAITQSTGTTLGLLSNTGTTFTPSSYVQTGTGTLTFNVTAGNNGSGTGNTLILANVGQFGSGNATPTFNFAVNNSYTLQLGSGSLGTGALSFYNNTTVNSTVAGGTVSIPGGMAVNYAAPYTLTFGGAGNISVGALAQYAANALTVTSNSTGTVTLTGTNVYTGATTVKAGTLTYAGSSTGTLGAISVGGSGTTQINIQAGTYAIGAGGFFVGTAALGAGTVSQTGGAVSFNSGSLELLIGNGAAGTYNLSGGSLTTFAGTSRGVMLGVNGNSTQSFNLSGTGTLNVVSGSTLMVGRSESGQAQLNSSSTFSQTGGTANITGTLTMGGPSGGTVTGSTNTLTLTGGTFTASAFTLLSAGNGDTSTINIGGTAVVTLPAFPTARGTGSTATITFDSTTGYLSPNVSSASYMPAGTFANAYLTTNGANFNVPNADPITIGQAFQDKTTLGVLTKSGTGTLTLTGANTYSGPTLISAGTLQAGVVSVANVSGGFGNNSAVTLANVAGASLNITGYNTQIGSLTGGGATGGNVTLGAATLTVGGDNTSPAAYAGVISSTGSPVTSLIKIGSGTLTLSGANTYSGLTAVNNGTLSFTGTAVGAAAQPIGENAGLTLGVAGTSSGILSYVGTGAAVLDKSITVQGNGNDKVQNNGTTAGPSGVLTLTGGITGSNTILAVGGTGDVTIASSVVLGTGSGELLKTGVGTLNINSGTQTYNTLQIAAGSGTTNVNTALNAGTTVNANATTNFTTSQTLSALNIGGTSPLAELGAAPSFSGGVAVGSVVTPEPGSLGLLLVGALGLAGRRRREV